MGGKGEMGGEHEVDRILVEEERGGRTVGTAEQRVDEKGAT